MPIGPVVGSAKIQTPQYKYNRRNADLDGHAKKCEISLIASPALPATTWEIS